MVGQRVLIPPDNYVYVGSSPTSVAISISPRSPIGRGSGLRRRPVSVRI